MNYHYLEYPASGPCLFLLHGLGSSTYSWEALAPLLQAGGYRVFALDLKGFGWSDKPADSEYDLFTLRDEIDRWLETMGLRAVIFVGNSLGRLAGAAPGPGKPEPDQPAGFNRRSGPFKKTSLGFSSGQAAFFEEIIQNRF